MKRLFSKVGLIGIVVAAVTISFCFTALAAEKKKFVYSAKGGKFLSEINLHDPTDQKYKITQWSRLYVYTEHNDPSLIGAEMTSYGQGDYIDMGGASRGISRGYSITRSKDGDCTYAKWEATWAVTVADFVNWEVGGESKFQIIGGTGKYLDAKGNGTCQFKTTPTSETMKCEGEWEY